MTIEELSQLSDEELRVKVAEKMGWKMHDHPDCLEKKKGWISQHWRTWVMKPNGELIMFTDIPPFSTSLDAMSEAEKTLPDANLAAMMRILYWMLIPERDQYPDHFLVFKMAAKIATAKARERAIAFLLV